MAWAYEQRVGSPTRKAVLVALANAANHHSGLCFPSISRLAHETELSERAVRKALADLCDQGLIVRERTRNLDGTFGRYHYRFPQVERGAHPAAPRASGPAAPRSAEPEVREPREDPSATPQGPLAQGHESAHGPPRSRNEIWDTLEHIFGRPTTESARSCRGKIVRSLQKAGASPDEIIKRAKRWPHYFGDAILTDTALERHWDVLGRPPLRAPPKV